MSELGAESGRDSISETGERRGEDGSEGKEEEEAMAMMVEFGRGVCCDSG